MAETRPRNVRVPVELRDRVRDICDDAEGITATSIVVAGLRRFAEEPHADGVIDWAVDRPATGPSVQLSYRIPQDVADAADARCAALERYAAGRGVVLTTSLVAVHALADAVATEAAAGEGA